MTTTTQTPVRRSESPEERPEPLEGTRPELPDYVDHPRFHDADAESFVAAAEAEAEARRKAAKPDDGRGGRGLPGHLRALCRAPLLSKFEERALFLRLNLERFRAQEARDRRDECSDPMCDKAWQREEELASRRAETARQRIVLANTRLVVSIARKFVAPNLSFDDLLAAGFEPLMRSVDLFDVSRGFRFSTYATWAIRNHILRVRKRTHTDQNRFRTGDDEVLGEIEGGVEPSDLDEERRKLVHRRIRRLLAGLDERDRTVVEARFGLNGYGRGRTFAEIGEIVGLSKERARQLVNRALEELRETPDVERLLGV